MIALLKQFGDILLEEPIMYLIDNLQFIFWI